MQQITIQDIDWAVQWLKYWAALIPAVKALIALIGIDILTGWMLAISKHTLNSSTSFAGMSKKVAILLMVTVGVILEPFANGMPLTLIFATGFLFQEVLSITENMAALGVPIPQNIVDILEKVQSGRKAKLDQKGKGTNTIAIERNIKATEANTQAINQRVAQEANHEPRQVELVAVKDPVPVTLTDSQRISLNIP